MFSALGQFSSGSNCWDSYVELVFIYFSSFSCYATPNYGLLSLSFYSSAHTSANSFCSCINFFSQSLTSLFATFFCSSRLSK